MPFSYTDKRLVHHWR